MSDWLEDALLSHRVADLVDADGRPLGEPEHQGRAPTRVVTCRYADRRRGHPMNLSALRQIRASWAFVLDTVGALCPPGATTHAAWRACLAGTLMPLRHHRERPEAPIPRELSALYKATVGLLQVLTALQLSEEGFAARPLASLGTAEQFLAALDDGGWLIGEEQACAGPSAMIGELFDALAGARGHQAPAPVPAELLDRAVVIVATAAGRLGDGLLEHGRAPWMFAVTRDPERRPWHARRLLSPDAALQYHGDKANNDGDQRRSPC